MLVAYCFLNGKQYMIIGGESFLKKCRNFLYYALNLLWLFIVTETK